MVLESLAPERERMLGEGTLEETLAPFLRAVDSRAAPPARFDRGR